MFTNTIDTAETQHADEHMSKMLTHISLYFSSKFVPFKLSINNSTTTNARLPITAINDANTIRANHLHKFSFIFLFIN